MRPLRLFPAAAALVVLATLATLNGCGAAYDGGPGAAAPNANLPAYSGDSADQFDDAIEAHAVGLELENYSQPKGDLRLRARAQAADVVVRARVSTVTGEVQSGNRMYQISFKAIERLAGKRAPAGWDDFTVRVDKASPSLGIVKTMEGQLVGKTLLVFAKAFARSDGDRDIHFHAMADGPDTTQAVKEAVILDEVSASPATFPAR